MEKRLVDLGFSLIVATTDEDPATEERKVKELLDTGVEGLVLTGATHSDAVYGMLERWRVPAIAMSCFDPDHRLPTIAYDNADAARMTYEALLASHPARVAVVHGPVGSNDRTIARLTAIDGFLPACPHEKFATTLSVAGGAQAATCILHGAGSFDAILCLSDVLAYSVLHAVQRAGLRITDDLSVMGMQDLPASAHTVPRLSTVHLPVRRTGRQAAESLAAWVTDKAVLGPIEFKAKLTLRETVRLPGSTESSFCT